MKKHFIYSAAICLFATLGFGSCKKDNKSAAADTTAFKNTIWTGEFNYSGRGTEPMSIEFIEGGQLYWRELLANHAGAWKIEGKKLSISLDGAPSFTGDVSSDNSLTNLQSSDAGGRTLKNATWNKEEIPALDNTVWSAAGVSLKFKPGMLVDLWFGPAQGMPRYPDMTYTRNGRAIHFNPLPDYNWFTVINSNLSMKGTNHAPNDPTVYAFLVTKQ
jgi:hypothetical protein